MTENKSLERLLRFAETKLKGNILLLSENKISKGTYSHEKTGHIEKLENMVESLMTKIDSLSHNLPKQNPPCKHCKRTNPTESNRFTTKMFQV